MSHSHKLILLLFAAILTVGCSTSKTAKIDPAMLGANVVLSAFNAYEEHKRMQDRSKWRLSDLDVGTVTVKYFSDDAGANQIKEYVVKNNDITIVEFIDRAIYEMRNTRQYALGNLVYYTFEITCRNDSHCRQIMQVLLEFHNDAVLAGRRLF